MTINNYLNRGTIPPLNNAALIARALDVPIEALLTGKAGDPVLEYENVPVIGQVPAGPFSEAIEVRLNEVPLPRALLPSGDIFGLKIAGDSMVGAGLVDGGIGIFRYQNKIESGSIAALVFDGEGTVKRVRRFTDLFILESANANYPPVIIPNKDAKRVRIAGRLILALTEY